MSQRTIAAVRQYEINVNITLVTTRTWLVVGPRRRGCSVIFSPEDIAGGFPRDRDSARLKRHLADPSRVVVARVQGRRLVTVHRVKEVITRGGNVTVKRRKRCAAAAGAAMRANPRLPSSRPRAHRGPRNREAGCPTLTADRRAARCKADRATPARAHRP